MTDTIAHSSEKKQPVPVEPVAPLHRPGAKAVWGPVAGLLYGLLVAFVGGSIAAGLITTSFLVLLGFDERAIGNWRQTISGALITSVIAAVLTVVAVLAYVKRRGGTFRQLGVTPVRWQYVWTAVIGILAYLLSYVVIVSIVNALVPTLNLEQRQNLGFDNPEGPLQLAAVFLALVVLPPIVEELVFRGFVFGGLRTRFNFWVTAIITSAVFAVGHLQFGNDAPLLWVAAIDTFILSMVMCYVRERTGSIIPTMIMHALKNLLAFSFLYIFVR